MIALRFAIPVRVPHFSCDVRALTYCDLKLLHIPGFVEVLWLYPDFKDKFAEDIIHDLTYNLREGYVPEVRKRALSKAMLLRFSDGGVLSILEA